MTLDDRIRSAVLELHEAGASLTPVVLSSRATILRRRAVVGALAAIVAVIVLLMVPSVLKQLGVQQVETADQPSDDNPVPELPGPSDPLPGSLPRFGGGRAPRGSEGFSTESQSGGSGGGASGRAGDVICDPLITDPKGDTGGSDNPDTDNPAIDILEASMTYDPSRNALVVREVFDDIPDNPPGPNQALYYTFWFTLDGTRYQVEAYIGAPTGYQWEFYVHRARRDGSTLNLPVMIPTGRVDTQADTVTIEIDVDEFNRGERRVSDEEGLPPAAELRRGSTFKKIYMEAYPVEAGAYFAFDDAYAGCDYVVR